MRGKSCGFLLSAALFGCILLLAGCGGGSSPATTSTSPSGSTGGGGGTTTQSTVQSVSGKVADGLVSGATITVYSDAGLTNSIGSGLTNASGVFSFNLNSTVTSIPSPVYIKSTGGTDLGTGLPAATMVFVGTTSGTGINITPLTNSVYQYSLSSASLSAALTTVETKLSISSTDLYGDPTADTTAETALEKISASGEQAATLPDGSYYIAVVHFSDNQINGSGGDLVSDISSMLSSAHNFSAILPVTISNGIVNGTMGSDTVSGRVSGSAMVLDISGTNDNIYVAGTIGHFGGIAGTFIDIDSSSTPATLHKGVFAASAVPTGVSADTFMTALSEVYNNSGYNGKFNFVARGLFSNHHLVWGQVNAMSIPASVGGAISTTSLTATTTVELDTLNSPTTTPNNLTGTAGKMVSGSDMGFATNFPTALAVVEYSQSIGSDDLYVIQPVGSRTGIWISVNSSNHEIDSMGDTSLTLPGSITSLAAEKYDLYASWIGPEDIGVSRATVIGQLTSDQAVGTADFSSCTGTGFCTNANTFGLKTGQLGVFAGDTFGMVKDDDGVWGDGESGERVRMVHFFDSGAFQGTEVRPYAPGDLNSTFTGSNTTNST
ncbi:MAG: hypothetical protein M0Z58_09895, partial [Nitrospiraceae bacterium]|nr:hypothetical protein [Nitrospiraceae bacterium]